MQISRSLDVLLGKKDLIKAKDGAVLTADEVKTNAEKKRIAWLISC